MRARRTRTAAFCRWDARTTPTSSLRSSASTFSRAARTSSADDPRLHGAVVLPGRDRHARHADTDAGDLVRPVHATRVVSPNIYLPVGHPDNPFSANNQVARLYYSDGALGGRENRTRRDTQRYLAGVKGTTYGWDWDIAGLYIRSDTDVTRRNFYSYDRLLQGLAGTGPYGYYRDRRGCRR